VHVVIRGPDINTSMSRYLVTRLDADPRIEIVTEAEVSALHGQKWLEAVTLNSKSTGRIDEIETAALFCFIGAVPATDWLAGTVALDDHGFIRTDHDLAGDELGPEWATIDRLPLPLETSLPGVFAAGDVRAGNVKRVAAAVGEGSTAVRSVHQYLALAG
jgi:thioredoxin reductase (NADPH)